MQKKSYQHTRHINAKPDEWIHVRRAKPATPAKSGGDLLFTIAMWVGGIILVLYILGQLLPYIILGMLALAVGGALTKR